MRGVVARERMRLERTEAMRDVGGLVTDGCLGAHSVRLLAWPDGKHVAVTVDGRHHRQAVHRQRCGARRPLGGTEGPAAVDS